MPLTPFHFGVGLAAKAVLSSRFYLLFFVGLQVLTDVETLYNLVHQRYPVHRFLHTLVGATVLALAASAVVLGLLAWRRRVFRSARELPWATLLLTALFSTWSHVVLDGIMHADVRPFAPFSASNPLLGLVSVAALHGICILCGVLGGGMLLLLGSDDVRDTR